MKYLGMIVVKLGSVGSAAAGGPFDHLPILEKNRLTVTITGERTFCMGMAPQPFPCFEGVTKSGRKISFDTGISGYTFREGRKETIQIEEIKYDFSGPAAPMDTSSIRYVLK